MTAVQTICDEIDAAEAKWGVGKTHSVVVATDGSEAADSAFWAATLIARRSGCRVHIVSVLEPLPLLIPTPEATVIPMSIETERTDAMNVSIARQARRFDPAGAWSTSLLTGRPSEAIARFAQEHDAGLIIIGASRRGVVGRMLGEETAMEIARIVDVPLLVASAEMMRLPRRVLIAMDIKPYGLELLPAALCRLADTKTVTCLHVKPRADFMGIDWAELDNEYEIAMQERFSVVEKALGKAGFRPDLIVRHGDVTHELAEFTEYSKAELVVVGINRRPGRLRTAGGRLAGRMLRQLGTSILIVPGLKQTAGKAFTRDGEMTETLHDPNQWGSAMKAFTARNAGRICTLEIDDPEIGALVEARAYPLVGVDYDHKDERLTIMLGDTRGAARHLSRSVPHPDAVSILSLGARDAAMSVAHGSGQTLLTFQG